MNCTDPNHLKQMAISHFQQLYLEVPVESRLIISYFPALTDEEFHSLSALILSLEVKQAVDGMVPYKAPRLDGLQAVLVDRLRPLLPKLIAPTQSSFIPGRVTSENIIITQELLHTMRKKKGRSRQMAIKIDLEKAYDKISWSFLHSVLLEIHRENKTVALRYSERSKAHPQLPHFGIAVRKLNRTSSSLRSPLTTQNVLASGYKASKLEWLDQDSNNMEPANRQSNEFNKEKGDISLTCQLVSMLSLRDHAITEMANKH
ncbi:hypothetical protein EZV62_007564 [Acer yangbiense]|uniref:Reverse transcriptase domain-containing protein n=1 Tax=Acer yangbiense TaxID=1000413 RepID=A0A5C7IBX5_9ROSI|nr:hypothetical protein EZV62_007564 [Acer yangbiense]